MTLWIESHVEMPAHPKTAKLARQLHIPVAHAVGVLHCLWHWALQYTEDGALGKFDLDDIAVGAHWDGDADELLTALVSCRWIDEGDQLQLHDWDRYAGKLMALRKARSEGGKKGAASRWGAAAGDASPNGSIKTANPRVNGSVNGSSVAEDGTDLPDRQIPTHQPNPQVLGPLRATLERDGFHQRVVDTTIRQFEERGDAVRNPKAWCRRVAQKEQERLESAARVAVDGAGIPFEKAEDGRWRPS